MLTLLCGKFIEDTLYQMLSESVEVCIRYDKNTLAYFYWDTVYKAS